MRKLIFAGCFLALAGMGCAVRAEADTSLRLTSPEMTGKYVLAGEHTQWRKANGAPVLEVNAPKQGDVKGVSGLNYPGGFLELDLKPYAGKFLRVTGDIKARDVSVPNPDFLGIKFMIHCRAADGAQSWPAGADGEHGTFDWKKHEFSFFVPKEIESANLSLGLQNVTGTAWFKNVRLEEIDPYPAPAALPDGFKCQYDSRVTGDVIRRGAMSPPTANITRDDLRDLAAWGANLIRWQINVPNEDLLDLDRYNAYYDRELDRLDKFLPLCKKLGLKVVIDMHNPPGGRLKAAPGEAGNQNAAVNGAFRIFNDDQYFNAFVDIWRKIAKRYRGNEVVWGYDLCNEPDQQLPAARDYLQCQYLAAKAIRKIDPQTPIIIESNEWNGPAAYAYMHPLPLKNIVYQVHMYLPAPYTHQGVAAGSQTGIAYPGKIFGVDYDQAKLRQELAPVIAFQQKYGAKIYAGEFGVVRWAPGGENYLQDVLEIFEENRWSWSFHAFREWDGWSVEHGPVRGDTKPVRNTPRKEVLLRFLKLNRGGN